MAGEDAQKEPEFPANAGRDVLGSVAERRYDSSARNGHWCNRSHDPAMDSQSQREPEGTPARITASGLLGGPMRPWNTDRDGTRRPTVALSMVRPHWNSEPPSVSSRSEGRADAASQVDTERGGGEQGGLGITGQMNQVGESVCADCVWKSGAIALMGCVIALMTLVIAVLGGYWFP